MGIIFAMICFRGPQARNGAAGSGETDDGKVCFYGCQPSVADAKMSETAL